MYGLIRYVFGCAFFGLSLIILRKFKITLKKVHFLVISIITVLVVVLLMFIPFENLFITFESPKAAYDYYTSRNSDISLIVEGKNCDFIIVRKRESYYLYSMIPKTENGWKIGIGSDIKKVFDSYNDDGIFITVYQYKNTSDFFVEVYDINGGEIDVSDSYGNVFYSLKEEKHALEKSFYTYFANIPEFNSDYSMFINGTMQSLNKDRGQFHVLT